jgi:hypothetical protein
MKPSRALPAMKAASPEARPTTGQAELGGQVRSQAGAWERGFNSLIFFENDKGKEEKVYRNLTSKSFPFPLFPFSPLSPLS